MIDLNTEDISKVLTNQEDSLITICLATLNDLKSCPLEVLHKIKNRSIGHNKRNRKNIRSRKYQKHAQSPK
jgi:hypothetical protein